MDIEADNAPSLEGCGIGVTDSSPVGVVGELTCPEGLLFCVAITSDRVWDGILSQHLYYFPQKIKELCYLMLMPAHGETTRSSPGY